MSQKIETQIEQPVVELAPLSVPAEDLEIIQALRAYELNAFEVGRTRQSDWADTAVLQFDAKQHAAVLRDRKSADEAIITKLRSYQQVANRSGNTTGMLWAARCIEAFTGEPTIHIAANNRA
jgi:hypothetical protein